MKKLVFALFLTAFTFPAIAGANSNIKVSLWNTLAVAAPNHNIDEVKGLDLGIGSVTEEMTGLQFDFLYANAHREFIGVQWSWIYAVTPEFKGWQGALLAHSDEFIGLQSGAVTYTEQNFIGAQWGFINITGGFEGAQLGFINYAKDANGLQLGFVNYAEHIYGLQIGLANIARNGYFPAMIIVNGRF